MDLISNAIKDTVEQVSAVLSTNSIESALKLLAATLVFLTQDWPQSSPVTDGSFYDVIVVGAGSAGSVLANRLTEDPHCNLLLLEAGGNPPLISVIPGLFQLFTHSPFDWDYYSEPDGYTSGAQNLGKVAHTRGKMLGGTSSLDHLLYLRGSEKDYNKWAEEGNDGWNWESCMKYFKKSESFKNDSITSSHATCHGTEGPLEISPHIVNKKFKKKNKVLIKSFEELGLGTTKDLVCESIGTGNFNLEVTHDKSVRSSTAQCYLLPIKNRKNFNLLKHSLVTKIIFKDKTAVGVEVLLESGDKIKVYARKEVIISAGVFNSPQLLMLSGIGPKDVLKKFDIDVILDQPMVGQNLQDHVFAPVAVLGKLSPATTLETALSVLDLKSFPVPGVYGIFNIKKNVTEEPPQIQHITFGTGVASPILFYFCAINLNYNLSICTSLLKDSSLREVFYSLVVLLHPKSRGLVTLRSSDPKDPPVIHTGFFKDESDLEILSEAVKKVFTIKNTSYFKNAGGSFSRPVLPDCDNLEFNTDSYWKCYTRVMSSTLFHPVGTCMMGPKGVVDSKLRLRGIKNLRIVDASVMPLIPSANTGGPVIMIAEKAADLIKESYCDKV